MPITFGDNYYVTMYKMTIRYASGYEKKVERTKPELSKQEIKKGVVIASQDGSYKAECFDMGF